MQSAIFFVVVLVFVLLSSRLLTKWRRVRLFEISKKYRLDFSTNPKNKDQSDYTLILNKIQGNINKHDVVIQDTVLYHVKIGKGLFGLPVPPLGLSGWYTLRTSVYIDGEEISKLRTKASHLLSTKAIDKFLSKLQIGSN